MPFEVSVPADVTSGEHLGGIAVWEPSAATTIGSGEADSNAASTKITTVTRMVLTVFVTTPGPAVPNLTISGVRAQARPDGMYMLVAVTNDGTAATSGQGSITLQSEGFEQKIDLGDMVPEATTGYPVKWKTDPETGAHQAQVEIRYDDGAKVASWSGDFTVGKDETAALTDRLVAPGGQGGSTTPWLTYGLIGGLVLIVLIMGVALLHRRRPEAR